MSIGSTGRESARSAIVEQRIRDLERRTDRIPSRWGGGSASTLYIIRMGGGNTLATYGAITYYGLKAPDTAVVTTVPTAAPSTTQGASAARTSWGWLANADGSESLVWVGSYLRPNNVGTTYSGLGSIIPENTTVLAFRSIQMQIGSSGVYVPVYLPERVT